MIDFGAPTPDYKLEEADEEIIISISAPLAKPKEAVLVLEKDVFMFESNPYLLLVKLPHPVSDICNDLGYNHSTRAFKIRLKKVPAPFDKDLEGDDGEGVLNGASKSSSQKTVKSKCFYGFANKCSGMFGKFHSEFSEVVNLPNPDETDVKDRRKLRLEEEDEKWSDDHYLADMMETDHLESIFMYKPPWAGVEGQVGLTNDEKDILQEISKSAMEMGVLSEEQHKLAKCQIVDVLFAYAYNRRTTEGENTVESGWTINKLSSTLSWFEEFENLKAAILSCYRRSLIYPFYRNWKLAEMVHNDVVDILNLGPNGIARCLIEVIEIFNDSENRYLLNTLYVNNLCMYAVNMTSEQTEELSLEVQKVKVTKYEVNRDLPLLEVAAHITLEEETGKRESEVSNIADEMRGLIIETSGDSSNGDSSESDSSCETDSTQSSDKEN